MSLPCRQYWFNASLQNRSRAAPSIKTTRQIAPPGPRQPADWLWQQLHYPRWHIWLSPVVSSLRSEWVGMTGGNTGLIISRKLSDMTPCLNASTQKSVSETVSLSLMTALATVWPLHTWPWLAPSAQATPRIVNHLGSVTRGNQLQAQYLTLIFITQPTNKFRLHKPQYKADFMTSTSIPSGPASKSQRCPELQM